MLCQTLGGLEDPFQPFPNFEGLHQKYPPQLLPLIQDQALQRVLHAALQRVLHAAPQHICQGTLQGTLQGGLPALFCATGPGVSDNRTTGLLYSTLRSRNSLSCTSHHMLVTTRSSPTHTQVVEQCQQLVCCTVNAHTYLVHHNK